MINNKGFAVSTVLYTLLIAFLMFLGVALAQFETSSGIIGKANDDLVNGTKLEVKQVKISENNLKNGQWYGTNTLVKINSRYGTLYWPRDFYEYNDENGVVGNIKDGNKTDSYTDNNTIYNGSIYKNIMATCFNGTLYESCSSKNIINNSGIAMVTYKQLPSNTPKLSYVNKKSYIKPMTLDETASKIKSELQTAADDIIYNGMLDENSNIRNFIDEKLKRVKETKDTSLFEEPYKETYNSNIEIELKYDNIKNYLTDNIYNYLVDNSLDISSLNSYIIKLNYNSSNYGDISYNIIDMFYLMKNGLNTNTNGLLGQNLTNYWEVNNLNASDAEKVLLALAIAGSLKSVDNIRSEVPDISKFTLTYLVNGNLYDNDNVDDADLSSGDDSTDDNSPKFLRIIDTISGEYKELNLYNLYE